MEESLEAIDAILEPVEANIDESKVPEEWGILVDEQYEEGLFEETLPFNFEIAIAILEEDEEDIETDFVEALSEIGGEKQFPCDSCDKVCKSKGGLTRHVTSKHRDKGYEASKDIPALTKDGLISIVNKIKLNITNEGCWDKQITSDLKKITSNDSLFDAVLPIYKRFCVKRNQDKFLTEFYELIPTSSALFKCANQPLCSLVMISMTDHLVALFKSDHNSEQITSGSSNKSLDLSEHERGPLSYIAGYILAKLQKQCSSKPNDELQTLLQNMKCPGIENTYIDARSRGGLVTPCKDLVEIVEVIFRHFVTKQKDLLQKIPCDTLCNDALESSLLKSLWENILQGCNQDLSKQTTKLCLENIIKLYLTLLHRGPVPSTALYVHIFGSLHTMETKIPLLEPLFHNLMSDPILFVYSTTQAIYNFLNR
jgi:uncharacterized C2H2 Zn-finger protein